MRVKTERVTDFSALVSRARSVIRPKIFQSPSIKRVLLCIALFVFVGGMSWALHQRPDILNNLSWRWAMLALMLTVPITILCNAVEYWLMARHVGATSSMLKSLEVTIIASAANTLPLPGGAAVRVAAMKAQGASLKAGAGINIVGGLIWVAVAFGFAGFWLLVNTSGIVGAAFTLCSLSTLTAVIIVLRRTSNSWVLGLLLMLNRLLSVANTSLRFCWALLAIGYDVSYAQASVVNVSNVISAAVVIAPAGLGVRELIAAVIAPVVGMTPAIGFLGASLSRVIVFAATIPLVAFLAFRRQSLGIDSA